MNKEEARSSVMGAISMALKDPTLQQGFEIICKNLAELEKENAELKKACDETQELLDKQIEATYKLDKENAELKEENAELKRNEFNARSCLELQQSQDKAILNYMGDQLTKAKDLLKWALHSDPEHDGDFEKKWEEAEQFLSEVENAESR